MGPVPPSGPKLFEKFTDTLLFLHGPDDIQHIHYTIYRLSNNDWWLDFTTMQERNFHSLSSARFVLLIFSIMAL